MTTTIDKNKFYTPKEIAAQNLFPWIKTEKGIRNYLAYDIGHENILRTIVKQTMDPEEETAKHGIRYFVKGEQIIKILAQFEDGSLFDGR